MSRGPQGPRPRAAAFAVLLGGLGPTWACAGGSVNPDHPDLATEPPADLAMPGPERLVEGEGLHLISVLSADAVLYGRGPRPPAEQNPWPALYRVPATGGTPELLAQTTYRLTILRGEGQTQFAYMTPQDASPPAAGKSLGDIALFRQGAAAPQKITPKDPALMMLPLSFSPDGRYLLSHGRSLAAGWWFLDVTDLQSGRSRRLCWTLAATLARWLGFDGNGPRYLALRAIYTLNKNPALEGVPPCLDDDPGCLPRPPGDPVRLDHALFRVDVDNAAPVALAGQAEAQLPDGRVLFSGGKLQAVDSTGKISDVAPGPVQDFSTFVAGGLPYYVKNAAANMDSGPLTRVEKDGALTPLVDGVTYVWFAAPASQVAYVSRSPTLDSYDMWLVPLAGGQATQISTSVARYRPLPGGGVLMFANKGTGVYRVGAAQADWLPGNLLTVLLLPQDRLVAVERGTGALRLGRRGAENGDLGKPLALGVDVVEGVEREPAARTLIYSVPARMDGQEPGLFRQRL